MHLFDNGPRLTVADKPAIENPDRITIEAWVNTLSWPPGGGLPQGRQLFLYKYSGGFSWYFSAPRTGCSTTSRARSGTELELHRRHL